MSKQVHVYYGPCDSFYTCSHKPQKLQGLRDQLLQLGYQVDLVEVPYRNYCVLKMQDREIFRCNIKYLKFNTSSSRDPVAQRAVWAVADATKRFQLADDYLWLRSILIDHLMTVEHGPKNYWTKRADFSKSLNILEELSKEFEE